MYTRKLEQGSSLAWTAVFLITVLVPLMLLVVDGARVLYVRGRLQTATDAACEDAAWAAGDRLDYLTSGQTHLGNEGDALSVAQSTFAATLDERSRMTFTAALQVSFDTSSQQILCSATANLPVLFSVAGVAPEVTIPASAIAAIRFR